MTRNELAVEQAQAADAARAAGDTRPLLGLPITVKDSLETEGLRTTGGGSCAREDTIPTRDATVVARLRAAGAIVLAKTNLPEYSWSYETVNVVNGCTNNPRDESRTPGGSSGGEAALLGADASIAGIGTDSGGLIRVPSHYCGTVGLRPTTGRVPETGVWPPMRPTGLMDLLCVGPMARHVEDLELLLSVILGPDGVDPYASPVPLRRSAEVELGSLRVNAYADDGELAVTEATTSAVETAAAALPERGCAVESRPAQGFAEATGLFFATMAADGGGQARADIAAAEGRHVEQMKSLLDALEPLALSAGEFFELRRRLFDFRARFRRERRRRDLPGHARLRAVSRRLAGRRAWPRQLSGVQPPARLRTRRCACGRRPNRERERHTDRRSDRRTALARGRGPRRRSGARRERTGPLEEGVGGASVRDLLVAVHAPSSTQKTCTKRDSKTCSRPFRRPGGPRSPRGRCRRRRSRRTSCARRRRSPAASD